VFVNQTTHINNAWEPEKWFDQFMRIWKQNWPTKDWFVFCPRRQR